MGGLLVKWALLWVSVLAAACSARDPPALVVSPLAAPVGPPQGAGTAMADHNDRHLDNKALLAVVFSCIGVTLLLASCLFAWFYWRASHRRVGSKGTSSSDSIKGVVVPPILSKFNSSKLSDRKGSVAIFEHSFLEAATGKFHDDNIIGRGGFGRVYKANLAEGVVAVKRISGGGKDSEQEFENEVDLLGKIRQPNIVSLLGYCIHDQTRFLVYEFMQNGSLEMQLHGPSRGSALNWHIRMKIALDTARGLEHLHEHCVPPVIHRDLKSSNILLDSEFNAKVADFGLAVTCGDQTKGAVKLSGTLGYVAPEYLLDGKLTEKSDVYAFGVVLLELLMGRKPVEKMAPSQCQFIVTWAMPQLTDRTKLPNIVDPVIRGTMDLKHLYQVAAVAVLCVQPEPSYRPLITDVLHSLIPLVPMELGGSLRISDSSACSDHRHSHP